MAGTLLTGPAGSGKTQEARRLLNAAAGPMVAADFQSLYAALLLLERDPETGRYPERLASQAAYMMPLTEAIRQTVITFAVDREIDLVVTNSDGSPGRRQYLLSRLESGGETILDPGVDVVRRRLAVNGVLSQQCELAIDRYYGRL